MASSEGFSTEEQGEVLKIASQMVESLSLSSSPKSPTSLHSEYSIKAPPAGGGGGGKAASAGIAVEHLRRSHSGKCVQVKKDGAGGKGTMGKLLDTDGESHLDRNDPNYDSGEEPYQLVGTSVSDPSDDYKKAVVSIIEEYFSNGNVELAASDLRELGSSGYLPYFIKQLLSMAMDRHDEEKEMALVLLLALYAYVISPDQIQDGFFMLLESADDLAVDILDAVDILALFLARAVADNIIPRAFLNRAKKGLPESSKGVRAIQIGDKSHLSALHHAELVERKWSSTHITVEEAKKKIADLLWEYVESGNTIEACRCIRELGLSLFHHEVVKKALVLAMEIQTEETLIFELLKEAAEEGLISSSQMVKGFSLLEDSLDDLALNIPSAKTLFQSLVPKAISEGWLDASFAKPSGEDGELPDDANVRRFKEESVTIIHEYFLSDDIPKLIQSLVDLGVPEYNPIFLKKLITLAMERKNREKEMASVLLSSLHSKIFSCDDIANGFLLLLESAEGTALGILDASNELALFLARAVIDDVLVPHNLEEISCKLPPDSSGSETLRMARALLSARHAGERILMCWGGGTGWAVEDAKDKILKLLEEYESGGVVGEACQCIRDLGMPFFYPVVVKKALVMAMEKKNDRILDLLQECFTEGLITINQMTKGFTWIKDELDDLALDIPNAKEKFNFYVEHARKKGLLLPSFGSSASDGAGGKGTQGKHLGTDGESHLDQNDPNYDSGENTRMEKPNLDEFYHVFTSRVVKIHRLLCDEGDGSKCEKLERIQDKLFREFREEFCVGTVPPTWLEDRESSIHVFRISTAMTNLRFRINFLNTQLQVQRNKIDLTRRTIERCFGRVLLKKSSLMLRDSKKQKIIGFKLRRGLIKKKLWRWVELTNARSELYRINKLIFWETASIFLDALIFHYSLSCVQLVHFTDTLDYGVIVFVHSIYPFTKAIGMTAKCDELENFVVTDAKKRGIPLFREEDVPV